LSTLAIFIEKLLAPDAEILLQTVFRIVDSTMNDVAPARRNSLAYLAFSFENKNPQSQRSTFRCNGKSNNTRADNHYIGIRSLHDLMHIIGIDAMRRDGTRPTSRQSRSPGQE
jgi:hypothetical protein